MNHLSKQEIRQNISDLTQLDFSNKYFYVENNCIKFENLAKKRKLDNGNDNSVIEKIHQWLIENPGIVSDEETTEDLLSLCHRFSQFSPNSTDKLNELRMRVLRYSLIYQKILNKRPWKDGLKKLRKYLQEEGAINEFDAVIQSHYQELLLSLSKSSIQPVRIQRILENHRVRCDNLKRLAEKLSRKINKILLNKSKYQGKRAALTSLSNCRLELSPSGMQLILTVIPDHKKLLGEGSSKAVLKAYRFLINVNNDLDKQGEGEYLKCALKTVKGLNQSYEHNQLLKEFEHICSVASLFQEEGNPHLADPPRPLQPLASLNPNKIASLELEEKRYNSDFSKVLHFHEMRKNLEQKDKEKVSLEDKLIVIREIATSCFLLHKYAEVHGDVKPSNILLDWISVQQEQKNSLQPRSYLSDFGLSTPFGFVEGSAQDYQYWDISRCKGWITPFCDIYGLTICLAEIFVLDFLGTIGSRKNVIEKPEQAINLMTRAFINHQLGDSKLISFIFGSSGDLTPNDGCECIDHFLNKQKSNPKTTLRLKELSNMLKIFSFALALVMNVSAIDFKVYEFLEKSGLKNKINSNSAIDKRHVIQQLQESFPVCKPEVFLERLNEIIEVCQYFSTTSDKNEMLP